MKESCSASRRASASAASCAARSRSRASRTAMGVYARRGGAGVRSGGTESWKTGGWGDE